MSDFDFQPYRDFILLDGDKQRALYTPTDALLPLQVGMVAQREQGDQTDSSQERVVEQLPVLDGLRKYALGDRREHVILAGRPGSGKSTALQQLRLALAAEGLVPVLVQLKGNTSILEAIASELEDGDLELEAKDIKRLLRGQKLILLLDGVNEIPIDELRRSLSEFREKYLTVPMIFTTRDLAVGGDFGIKQRLEMKPLTELQMRKFVGQRLPVDGEKLLAQLGDRLREIAETPLLLKMLCDVFGQTGQIPESKGELFRLFDREYDKFKGFPPVSKDSRLFKSEILQHLAFVMMTGDSSKPTEFWLTINRGMAEREIERFLIDRRVSDPAIKAKEWLENLLDHHLLQIAADARQMEFPHQLFQEYYATEKLLNMFQDNHSDVIEEKYFQHFYLNYIKWTEVIGMTLSLMDDEKKAIKAVEQSLKCDLRLGARLAGQVKLQFHPKTLALVERVDFQQWLLVDLLDIFCSELAIPTLTTVLYGSDSDLRKSAIIALKGIGTKAVIPILLTVLRDQGSHIHYVAQSALEEIDNKVTIPVLIETLNDSNSDLRESAIETLGKIVIKAVASDKIRKLFSGSEHVRRNMTDILGEFITGKVFSVLVKGLKDSESHVRWYSAHYLGEIGYEVVVSDLVISALIDTLQDSEAGVREKVAEALGEIGDEVAIPALLTALRDLDAGVRVHTSDALGKVGNQSLVPTLITALHDPESWVRQHVARALQRIGDEAAISALITALHDPEAQVRIAAVNALNEISAEEVKIPLLTKALNDLDVSVRRNASGRLGEISTEKVIPALLMALQDSDSEVCSNVIYGLGQIGTKKAASELKKTLYHPNSSVRHSAVRALQGISINETIVSLMMILFSDLDSSVRCSAVNALGELGNELQIPALLVALRNSDASIRCEAAYALGKIGNESAIPGLIEAINDSNVFVRRKTVRALKAISTEASTSNLIGALYDSDADVRIQVACTLKKKNTEAVIPILISALNEPELDFTFWYANVANILKEIGTEESISTLIKALNNSNFYVRGSAAKALTGVNNEVVISALLATLNDQESHVRKNATCALGEIGTKEVLPALVKTLNDSDSSVRRNVVDALSGFKNDVAAHILPDLSKLLPTKSGKEAWSAIQSIQINCKFYNYDIFCSLPPKGNEPFQSTLTINCNIEKLGILNTGNVNIEGNQTGKTP